MKAGWFAGRRTTLFCGILSVLVAVSLLSAEGIRATYRYSLVRAHLQEADFVKALETLEGMSAKAKKTARWHYLRAKVARRSGDASIAARELSLAEELGWRAEEIARQRLLLRAQANIRDVEAELQEAVLQGGTDEEAEEIYEAMARGYMHALRFREAIDCLNYWSQWQPTNPLPHLWKGELHERKEKLELAAEEYQQALQGDPNRQQARLKLAQVRLKQLDIPAAAALFEECPRNSSEAHRVLLGLADCKRRQGEAAQARVLLHEVLLLDLKPDDESEAWAALARMDREEGRLDRSIALFSQALRANPNDIANRLAFSGALAAAGQAALAEQQRKLAKEMTDRHERLLKVLQEIEQKPENADLRCQAGEILMEQGLVETGLPWLDSALQLNPRHPQANRVLADYFRGIGANDVAQKHEVLAAPSASASDPSQKDN